MRACVALSTDELPAPRKEILAKIFRLSLNDQF